jgi:calcium permeable stress-gated cation channel
MKWWQEAMKKDTLERAREPNLDLKAYLANSYLHPVFKGDEGDDRYSVMDDDGWMEEEVIVPTKRHSRRTTPAQSKHEGSDSLSVLESSLQR